MWFGNLQDLFWGRQGFSCGDKCSYCMTLSCDWIPRFCCLQQAIQAHDLHTWMDVCMKIIKNNKDFFDQSLDESKLLKYINKARRIVFCFGGGRGGVVGDVEGCPPHANNWFLIFVVISVKSLIIFCLIITL